MKVIALISFPLFLLSSPPIALHGQPTLESEVQAVLPEYVGTTNAGEIERLAALYLNSPTRYRGAMTIVSLRTSDGWKGAHDHTSTLPGTTVFEAGRAPTQTVLQGGPPAPIREPEPCEVTRIVDGDTIECAPLGRVRLIGMDTPEAGQQPFGEMATEALHRLLTIGTEVRLEPDVEARDRYGRVLGYVWAEGVLVNWALVRQGYAVLLTYPPNVQYVDWLTSAQTVAREEGLGLWAIDGFACPPSEYRRGRCR